MSDVGLSVRRIHALSGISKSTVNDIIRKRNLPEPKIGRPCVTTADQDRRLTQIKRHRFEPASTHVFSAGVRISVRTILRRLRNKYYRCSQAVQDVLTVI